MHTSRTSKAYGALFIDSNDVNEVSLLPLILLSARSPRLVLEFWRLPPTMSVYVNKILDVQSYKEWREYVLHYVSSLTITVGNPVQITRLPVQVKKEAREPWMPWPCRWDFHEEFGISARAWEGSTGLDVVGIPMSRTRVTVELLTPTLKYKHIASSNAMTGESRGRLPTAKGKVMPAGSS